ncbi:MAG: polyprenyl synthetase family protein [Rhizobiaceae bacterium]|nr:polyprenyl synthetase family protein [Rhizobiaceae bacterium]
MTNSLQQTLKTTAQVVNQRLDQILTLEADEGELVRPPKLVAAMRHGLLNGGKRLRPFLVIQSAALFGVDQSRSLQTACALECLHSYSLVHDDLPQMDDDDLRRGQPTVHKAYDEATAILAGDALLTLAFDLITDEKCHGDSGVRCELANLLARASGMDGMIGGQMLDLEAEAQSPGETGIRVMQQMKTGALIQFACTAGAVLGQASNIDRSRLAHFGNTIGLAFQLADDLLDVTSNAETMGKAVGKDAGRGKGTLIGLLGVSEVRELLSKAVEEAVDCLSEFGAEADILRQTAHYVVERRN